MYPEFLWQGSADPDTKRGEATFRIGHRKFELPLESFKVANQMFEMLKIVHADGVAKGKREIKDSLQMVMRGVIDD